MTIKRQTWATALGAVSLGMVLSGCGSDAARLPREARLDGAVVEWPSRVVARGDDRWLHFRFSLGSDLRTIQANDETVALLVDADADAGTGWRRSGRAFDALGADLEVQFSPLGSSGPRRGVAAFKLNASGARAPIALQDIDLTFSPTYASRWYEGRLSRDLAQGLVTRGMSTEGAARGIFALYDGSGRVVGYSEPFELEFPRRASGRALADLPIPARPTEGVRIVTWNTWRKFTDTPEAFAPILEALDPDVVLFQEYTGTQESLRVALDQHVANRPSPASWSVVMNERGDVAIASRLPLTPAGPSIIEISLEGRRTPVRVVCASAQSVLGPIFLASMHLKCCGSVGSEEDQRRMAEARAINDALRQLSRAELPEGGVRVLGGDINLVGGRPPIDLLRADLDADASDLETVEATVLGDPGIYTWRDWSSGFSPGRLDWLVYSDSNVSVARSFVLDTRRLTDGVLSRAGLARDSSDVSDHLPVVVDLVPRVP